MDFEADRIQRQTEFAVKHHLTYEEYKRLVSSMTTEEVITCLELLRATKHNSSFRLRMESKVREWISKADPLMRKPFSSKEFEWLRPKWPIKYQLP